MKLVLQIVLAQVLFSFVAAPIISIMIYVGMSVMQRQASAPTKQFDANSNYSAQVGK